MENEILLEGEHFEPLGNGVKIIVNKEYRFSTDTVLLANFSKPRKNDIACELGSGCGPIPLIWARDNVPKLVSAVEIQEKACDLFKRSIKANGFEEKVQVINRDLRELKGVLSFGSYNLVVSNPPYKLMGTGILNPAESDLIARHEYGCSLEDITEAAKNLLQFGGRFCICQRPERLTDVLQAMRNSDLEPKRLRFVQQREKKEPKLFLAEGRRGGKKGFMQVMPTLYIEDETGDFSQEMKDIYGCYKNGRNSL